MRTAGRKPGTASREGADEMPTILTRELAFAAGQDAANRAMAKRIGQNPRSPKRWTAEEADIAAAKTNQLLLYVPFAQGGIEGLNLSPKMRADLGITEEGWARARGDGRIGDNGAPALDKAA